MNQTAWDPWKEQVDRELDRLRRDLEEVRRCMEQLQVVFVNMLPAVNEISRSLRDLGERS